MATWIEKFEVARQRIEDGDDDSVGDIDADFFISENGVPGQTIDLLRVAFPRISEEYLSFLKHTDGADIAQCTFFGSEASEFSSFGAGAYYESAYPRSSWLVVGHDAGGNPFLLGVDGSVAIGDEYLSGMTRNLAPSFSSFLSDVLFGPDYGKVHDSEPDKEDPWFRFLRLQNWT